MSFFDEIKRRKVARVALGYLVIAWLIMQIGDTLGPALRLPEWIPSALAFFLILGFPFALYLSWVYDMTPDGLKPDSEGGKSSTRKVDRVIFSVLVLAVVYFAVDRLNLGNKTPDPLHNSASLDDVSGSVSEVITKTVPASNTIAVLPFINMSSDPEQEYFSDGLSEELLNLLARIPELQVTSRSSAFAYKGKEINIPEVASTLGVAHIIEGSVRKNGDQIRVTAQLIDAARDVHLWSETYNHTLEDIFSIQDEISLAVVSALKVTLLEVPKARQVEPEALDLVLQAKFFWHRRGAGDFERAREYYEKSLEIDSSNAPAWSGLAVIYNELIRSGELSADEGLPLFKNAALSAVEADPDYPNGHIRLAWAYGRENNTIAAEKHRKIAQQLDPNNHLVIFDQALRWMQIGRDDKTTELYERLARQDPLSAITLGNLANQYMKTGKLEKSEQLYKRALQLSPDSPSILHSLATVHVMQGRFDDALNYINQSDFGNYNYELLSIISFATGDFESSDTYFNQIVDEGRLPAKSWHIRIHAYRGELEKAFSILKDAMDMNIGFQVFLRDPLLVNMHEDPRWDAWMREAGWNPDATLD